jgi:O-antigen/teichoic acid export membrane protein
MEAAVGRLVVLVDKNECERCTMSTVVHQNRLVSDTIRYVPVTLIRALAGFLIVPLITRYFDADIYGKYTLSLSVLTFMQIFVNSWINITTIRFYAQAEVKQETPIFIDSILAVILMLTISISVVSVTIVWLVRTYIDELLFQLLVLIPIALISSSIGDFPLQILRARRNIGLFSILSTITTICTPIIGLLISHILDGAIIGLLIGLIIIQVVILIVAFVLCFKTLPTLKFFNIDYARQLMNFGMPLVPSALFTTVLDISDRFLLNIFRGSTELGIYAVNYTISWTIISLLSTLIAQSSGPLIVAVWEKEGRQSTERVIKVLLHTYLTICIPSVAGLGLIGMPLARVLLANDYVEGAVIYPYVASGALVMGIQWIAQRGIILSNRTDLHLKSFFIGSIVNILLNIALIPSFGYIGSAIATLVANIVLLCVIAWFSARYITIVISWLGIARILISSCVMIIISSIIPDIGIVIVDIGIKCVVSVIIYSMMLIVLREWKLADVMQVLRSYRVIR